MEELKNKDGVPIIIDQVWLDYMGNQLTILNAHDYQRRAIGQLYDRKGRLDSYGFNIDDGSLTRLISCPTLGDMSEWRVPTKEEREKYPIPACAEWHDTTRWRGFDQRPFRDQWGNVLWRVPLDFDFEAEQEPYHPPCPVCNAVRVHCYDDFHDPKGQYASVCENCYEARCKTPATCPDCNKAVSVCECGIQRAFRATIAENAAPDTLEFLGEVFDYDTVRDTVNALIKRTDKLN